LVYKEIHKKARRYYARGPGGKRGKNCSTSAFWILKELVDIIACSSIAGQGKRESNGRAKMETNRLCDTVAN
jgi:hypothetical protein